MRRFTSTTGKQTGFVNNLRDTLCNPTMRTHVLLYVRFTKTNLLSSPRGEGVMLSSFLSICDNHADSIQFTQWIYFLVLCLSVRLYVCTPVCPFICLSICLSVCPSVCLSISPSVCRSVHLSVRLSVHLFICLSVRPFVYLSVCPSVCVCVVCCIRFMLCVICL